MSTKKEIFNRLSDDEKKRFPDNASKVIEYKNILEQEIITLEKDEASVTSSNKKELIALMRKYN